MKNPKNINPFLFQVIILKELKQATNNKLFENLYEKIIRFEHNRKICRDVPQENPLIKKSFSNLNKRSPAF